MNGLLRIQHELVCGRVFPGQTLGVKNRKPHPFSAPRNSGRDDADRYFLEKIASKNLAPKPDRQPNITEGRIGAKLAEFKSRKGERKEGMEKGMEITSPSSFSPSLWPPFHQASLSLPLLAAKSSSPTVLRSQQCRIHAQQNNKGNLFTLA